MEPDDIGPKWERVKTFVEAIALFAQQLNSISEKFTNNLYSWSHTWHETGDNVKNLQEEVGKIKDQIQYLRTDIRELKDLIKEKNGD